MIGLLLLVAAIAAADSLNPPTVGPALVLAVGGHPVRQLVSFIAGVFTVSALGGLVLVLGPGQAALHLAARPTHHTDHIIELAAGGGLLAVAALLWRERAWVARRLSRDLSRRGRSAGLLGAGIMAVELPTAFPYFAALAAIVGSGRALVEQISLVVVYDAIFVAPLAVVLAVVLLAGERGARIAVATRARLERWAPELAPVALSVLGVALLAVGAVGLGG